MNHALSPAACRRLIVKVGSSLLVDASGAVRREWLATLVADIARRIAAGQQVAVVSSGAIALGARRLKLTKGGRANLEDAQAAAAVGQIALAGVWADLLGDHGLTAAQMLVTLDDLEDRRRYLNASATLERLLSLKVVPIINENDSVATHEIKFGDNDRLAARIGAAANAQGVVLLSDVDGLYTADPTRDTTATRIERVTRIDAKVLAMAGTGTSSGMGSGGMASKIEAARIANSAGADLIIISGHESHPLTRMDSGENGTVFVASARTKGRKTWLAGRLTVRGTIHVDAGAVRALASGASLLAAGAKRTEGSFSRGDVVDIAGPDGTPIARGLSEYDAADAARITGLKSDAIAAVLGYAPRSALIHRDHMVHL
ncbi:glutamate 5-kinase [Sphingomonas paeninsulae]|uniref:Glutamate 5-kinase n=1 Tax=Sphingomonas paeninsulae TaxID=2319844 RepID=A0A494TL27_SPHPE|nr:glutamate 5-kinase [Sphingomonas paeninsulae]AYJ86118.1 glutamate 5-kinase [Sphingomonas paeninsulae]